MAESITDKEDIEYKGGKLVLCGYCTAKALSGKKFYRRKGEKCYKCNSEHDKRGKMKVQKYCSDCKQNYEVAPAQRYCPNPSCENKLLPVGVH